MQQLYNKDGKPLYLYEIRFARGKEDWIIASSGTKQYAYGKLFGTTGRQGGSRVLLVDTDPAQALVNARRVLGRTLGKWSSAKDTLEEPAKVKSAVVLLGRHT